MYTSISIVDSTGMYIRTVFFSFVFFFVSKRMINRSPPKKVSGSIIGLSSSAAANFFVIINLLNSRWCWSHWLIASEGRSTISDGAIGSANLNCFYLHSWGFYNFIVVQFRGGGGEENKQLERCAVISARKSLAHFCVISFLCSYIFLLLIITAF